jgi:hypothetical protein
MVKNYDGLMSNQFSNAYYKQSTSEIHHFPEHAKGLFSGAEVVCGFWRFVA